MALTPVQRQILMAWNFERAVPLTLSGLNPTPEICPFGFYEGE